MPYIFESGESVRVGTHGDTDYVYASGDPVPNTGGSTLIYETGVGLGGGDIWSYAYDQTDLSTVGAITSEQNHTEFYDYQGSSGFHGYYQGSELTILLHRDTTDGTYSLVVTANAPEESGYSNRSHGTLNTQFSQNIDYAETDGEGGDFFGSDSAGNEWNAPSTDGYSIYLDGVNEITLSFSNVSGIIDTRVITSDGPPPHGGSTDYYGGVPDSITFSRS